MRRRRAGGRDCVVEVGGDRFHLGRGEHAFDVQEARLREELPDRVRIVVECERPLQVQWVSRTVAQRDRARFVDRTAVEQATQYRFPFDEAVERPADQLDASGHLRAERRHLVLHQVGERVPIERDDERAVDATAPRDDALVDDVEGHVVAFDVEAERHEPEPNRGPARVCTVRIEERVQFFVDERARIERDRVTFEARPPVY